MIFTVDRYSFSPSASVSRYRRSIPLPRKAVVVTAIVQNYLLSMEEFIAKSFQILESSPAGLNGSDSNCFIHTEQSLKGQPQNLSAYTGYRVDL